MIKQENDTKHSRFFFLSFIFFFFSGVQHNIQTKFTLTFSPLDTFINKHLLLLEKIVDNLSKISVFQKPHSLSLLPQAD